MKQKIVIYTAISGNYEKLKQHRYISKNFDYICFTDQKIKKTGIWKIEPLKKSNLDLTRNARYHKIFPHILLKKYDYSIWIDSNIDVTSDKLEKRIYEFIEQKNTISSCIHFERDCIYQEAKACIDQQKDEPETIIKQVNFLKKEKYPKNNGLFETNILYRKHNDPKIIKIMEDWWKMIINFSKRDQLSFNYVLWKNKEKCNYVFPINSRLMKDDFKFYDHNTKIVSTIFIKEDKNPGNNNFIQKIIHVSNNKYKASFNLENFKKISQLRLNIAKNKFCQFKINKIKINDQKIDLSKIKYQTNGDIIKNKFIDFLKTSDPQIILETPEDTKKITICGNIYLSNLERLYLNAINEINKKEELQQKLDKLQSDLVKIQLSKTYILWQKYNKIKKIFLKNE